MLVHSGELVRAEETLAAAAKAGVADDACAALLAAVRAVRAGPGFEDPQGAIDGRFRVIGEIPPDACAELAARLVVADEVVDLLAPTPRPEQRGSEAQIVVYVFTDGDRFDALMERIQPPVRYAQAAYLGGVPTLYVVEEALDRQLRRTLWWERLDALTAEPPPGSRGAGPSCWSTTIRPRPP